jgi:hypothetical protein
MTVPGPDQIRKCPNCDEFISVDAWSSYNTFGALVWTDGKIDNLDITVPQDIKKCGNCRRCFWLRDSKIVGEYDWFRGDKNAPNDWKNAYRTLDLELQDFLDVLEHKLFKTRYHEKYLRIQLWWFLNDSIRPNGSSELKTSDRITFKHNLISLLKLLDIDKSDDAILMAEVTREIGDFQNCIYLLSKLENRVTEDNQRDLCTFIYNLATKKDSRVRLFKGELPIDEEIIIEREQFALLDVNGLIKIQKPESLPDGENIAHCLNRAGYFEDEKHASIQDRFQKEQVPMIVILGDDYFAGNPDNISEHLSFRLNYTLIKPLILTPTKDALQMVPKEMAIKTYSLPLRTNIRCLQITMADPTDAEVIKQLQEYTGKIIEPCISSISDIRASIEKYY